MFKKMMCGALLASVVGMANLGWAAEAATPLVDDVSATQSVVQTININTATAESIAQSLKGIGLKKAQAIVAYREAYGSFSKAEDLEKVKGIGEKTAQKLASQLTF